LIQRARGGRDKAAHNGRCRAGEISQRRKTGDGGADIGGCERIIKDSVLPEAEEDVRGRREKL